MPEDYLDRFDPDGETRDLVNSLAPLGDDAVAPLLKHLGVDDDTIAQVKRGPAEMAAFDANLARMSEYLAPLGWIVSAEAPLDEYTRAAELAEHGDSDAAEELLTTCWNEPGRLEIYLRVGGLYSGSQQQNEIAARRHGLIREALDAHQQALYGPAIALILAQIDGIVFDMTGAEASSFYNTGKKAEHLRDDITIAGHPKGLTVLAEMFCKDVRPTQQTGLLRRHGVLHGREVAYNTIENSTKAFVCLISVIEWAKPRADELAQQRRRDYVDEWAGSDATDEYGRRRDDRGFAEAKAALHRLHSYQFGYFKRNQRYCATSAELDEESTMKRWSDLRVSVADDGQGYFAWLETPSGWVFGIGGAEGDCPHFEYDDSEVPIGGPGTDTDWRHAGSELSPPNW